MYGTYRIISIVFLFFLVHLPHELSAEFLSGTKETNLTNDLYHYMLEHGFCDAFSGEAQRTWEPQFSSTKKMPKDFKIVTDSTTYNDLVNQLYQQTCDSAVGDMVVNTSNSYCGDGACKVAPSKKPEIFMVVPNSNNKKGMQIDMWIFAKAISWRVLVEMGSISIFVGVVIKYMEYRVDNAEFSSPLLEQFFMILWFPLSVLIFHEGHIANKWSKGVIFIWLCMAFMVFQCYIANLSSILTNQEPQQPFPVEYNYIGYRHGSPLKRILIRRFGFTESQLKPYSSIEEYHLALSRGSYNGGVDAIFDQPQDIDLFINSYGSQYIKIGPISKAIGFGFAFSSGSHYHFNFPIKSLNMDESSKVDELRKKVDKYHYYQRPPSISSQTQSLSAYNFGGLFIITVILIMLTMVCSEYSIWRKSIKSLPSHSVEASVHSTNEMIEVNGDLNIIEAQEDTSSSTSSTIHAEDSILIQEE